MEQNRTIYLGNINKDITPNELLNKVKTGAVESLRMLPNKNCAFLCFVDPVSAQMFFQDFNSRPLKIQEQEIKVGWGKPTATNQVIQQAIFSGATRNVYIGQIDDDTTEESLKNDLERFGEIEQVKIVRDKRIAFIHFLSVASALSCVTSLPKELFWTTHRVYFGKDRCASSRQIMMPHIQQQQLQQQQQQQQQLQNVLAPTMQANNAVDYAQRTIYLGNLPVDTTCEDICNGMRGGKLYNVRYLKEKNMAFVTFVDPNAAFLAFERGQSVGIAIKHRRVKVGWGKSSGIPFHTLMAIQQQGVTRNLYLGGTDQVTIEQIRKDFSQYGDIEMINHVKDKNCTFVNYTSINSAMQARQGIKTNPMYNSIRINYGKDRCDNPFKSPPLPNIQQTSHKPDIQETSYTPDIQQTSYKRQGDDSSDEWSNVREYPESQVND
ncbi:uncharacterized protein BX664DRAFT_366271 [Halteromyces radiatus]|uniref:uncharacterized protein n=1 Tax=Halteromyces radiatus TaxID=101107 RepID=UPI00221F7250|nr:uncharacterized protein BX664DRAFT_366271 [Halteromyces radiatus]KAI8084681.1 hypothetical protein BX664DRAFT_366271 [Halteromyces radiatus]